MQYKIDEISKKCGLTKRTIRYYEEIGLLSPPERSEGGYRLYSEKHLRRLQQIMDTREVLGTSLQDIQEFMDIREKVETNIFDLRQTEDGEERYQKLLNFKEVLEKQCDMIEQRIKKIIAIREDTHYYYERVNQAIKKYEEEKAN